MSQRVVMRLHEFSNNVESVEKFLAAARAAGAGSKSPLVYAVTETGEPCLYIELPERALEALERTLKPKTPKLVQKAGQGQPKARREAPKHTAPEARKKVIILKKKRPQ